LTPSSPAWAPACAAADELLELAWAVDAGTSDDMFGVALAFIRTVRAVPDGVAPAEVAYTEQLIRSIEQYIRVAPLAGDFVQNVEVLTLGSAGAAGLGRPSAAHHHRSPHVFVGLRVGRLLGDAHQTDRRLEP
jgi:hypothetical protein